MQQNNQHLHVDIAILGGGLAGLSLAAELAAPAFSHLKIVIIEPRETYVRDKTWSYWRHAPHAFSHVETAVWQAWQVQDAEKTVIIESSNAENYVYASIASDDFYGVGLAKIEACQHVSLLQGVGVESLRVGDNNCANILLKNGTNIVARHSIFDSRPPILTSTPHLTQHFMGLQLTAQSPTFDTNIVNLMDFKVSLYDDNAMHGTHFIYVLPFSSTEALIESTWLCHHQHHADYALDLHAYIGQRWPNVQFNVMYTETGSLPLVAQQAQESLLASVPVIPIGSRAGTARAATGYAFLETLADSARLAYLIRKNQPLTAFKRHKMDAWMDNLFLSFLSQQPTLAPNYFVQMFARCSPARLIRFLTGQASFVDRLSVVVAVPAWPMLKHSLAYILKV